MKRKLQVCPVPLMSMRQLESEEYSKNSEQGVVRERMKAVSCYSRTSNNAVGLGTIAVPSGAST